MSSTVWRGLLAGLVISLCTASAVSAAVLLLAADLAPGPGIHVPVDPTQAGEPQTVMIVGSDRRGDGLPVRSDTIILARLDKDRAVTAARRARCGRSSGCSPPRGGPSGSTA